MKRVIVCGSREWKDRARIADRLLDLALETDNLVTIVVGYDPEKHTPRGVDRMTYEQAKLLGLTVETHPANWLEFGKPAGFIRNEEMAAAGASLCIAFWDGASSGTSDMMKRSGKHGIPVEVIREGS